EAGTNAGNLFVGLIQHQGPDGRLHSGDTGCRSATRTKANIVRLLHATFRTVHLISPPDDTHQVCEKFRGVPIGTKPISPTLPAPLPGFFDPPHRPTRPPSQNAAP